MRFGSTTTNYTWDYTAFPLGRLTSAQEGSKTSTTLAYFEPSGLVQSVSAPTPGTVGTGARVTTSYTYDSLGNPPTSVRSLTALLDYYYLGSSSSWSSSELFRLQGCEMFGLLLESMNHIAFYLIRANSEEEALVEFCLWDSSSVSRVDEEGSEQIVLVDGAPMPIGDYIRTNYTNQLLRFEIKPMSFANEVACREVYCSSDTIYSIDPAEMNRVAARRIMQLGLTFMNAGRFSDAVEEFERARRLLPGDFAIVRDLAEALNADGRHDEATTIFEALIASDSIEDEEKPNLHRDLAEANRASGNHAKAIEHFKSFLSAIENEPQSTALDSEDGYLREIRAYILSKEQESQSPG